MKLPIELKSSLRESVMTTFNLSPFLNLHVLQKRNPDQENSKSIIMDRSNDEEQDYESYSEDFDQDDDDIDDEDDNQEHDDFIQEESDAEEMKVYKSLTGPSITIQPRPRKNILRTPVKTESDGSLLVNSPRRPLPKWKPTIQNSEAKTDNVQDKKVPMTCKKGKSTTSVVQQSATPLVNKRPLMSNMKTLKGRFTTSFSAMNIGKPGSRRVPGTTNVNNRGYTRSRHLAVSPYLPPMKLGPAKAPGTVAQRVASAKRMAVNDLKNKITQLQTEIEELRRENRTLNHMQNRQTLALRKWEGRDAELPRLLQQHKDELRSYQEQIKKAGIQCRDLEEKLRAKDKKLISYETELRRLKNLVDKEELQERQALANNMDIVSMNLSGAEKRIRQYMRHVEILQKNHHHQIIAEQQKITRANNHALELREEISRLKIALRDKDRMLNYIQMRSQGRNLLRSYQEKERVQLTRYQFPTLQSPRSRMGESHTDLFEGERTLLRSQSLDIRSSRSHRYDNIEHEDDNHKCLSGRDDSVNEWNHQETPKPVTKTETESHCTDMPTNRSILSDSRFSQVMPSPHNSQLGEPDSQSYYHMSQMLGSQQNPQDSKSSLPPKVPIKVRKQRRSDSPAVPAKIRSEKSHNKAKSKPSISKTTVVEFRDENNRKIKHYTTTHVASNNQNHHDHDEVNESHRSHHHKTERQLDVETHSYRPRSHSRATGNRENNKGLEVRVQIIKNPGEDFETQNTSTSRSSSSGISVRNESNSIESPKSFTTKADDSHRQNHVHFKEDQNNSSRSSQKHSMDGGDATMKNSSFLESEPEEMIRFHEAAIGDFISSSSTQFAKNSSRSSAHQSEHLDFKYIESAPNPSSITHHHSPSDSYSVAEISIPQVHSASMPIVTSPRQSDRDQSRFFTTSPNYPENIDTNNYINNHTNLEQQSTSHQLTPRGAYSHPQMTQSPSSYQKPQPRGIFSNTESMSPRIPTTNQPMNLPFFSSGSGPKPRHSEYYHRPTNIPQPYTNNKGGHYNTAAPRSQNSNAAFYDPSIYTKLGTWK